MRPANHLVAFAAAAAFGIQPLAAAAQQSPSTDQIINQLLPARPGDTDFRGIRLAKPSPDSQAVSPKPARASSRTPAASSATPAPESSQPAISLTVEFRTDSADLTSEAAAVLDRLGSALSSDALSSYRFRIEGHTDTVGDSLYNKRLSERRAQSVKDYLAMRYRIDPSRLEAVGFGKQGLLVPTEDRVPEPRNRRVQVVNLGT